MALMKNKSTLDPNASLFFSIVKAGLWEKEVQLPSNITTDYKEIFRLAREQAVLGLITAGLEHIKEGAPPKELVLTFIGEVMQIEQRNMAMNFFVGVLFKKMREAGINAVLVKGQGLAQCYERPLWRSCGDVDLFFDYRDYKEAKHFIRPLANSLEREDERKRHLGVTIDSWLVEIHGTMHTDISCKINKVNDEVQEDIFDREGVRCWRNDTIDVPLPSIDNDIIIVFTHFIDHFYGEGVGIRQICDWCRLIWTYREKIDLQLLEERLCKMGLMAEWKAFASFAVEYLGMPKVTMPFYSEEESYSRKASKICKLILETGNFGHNKDNAYRNKHSKFLGNIITFFRRFGEFARISTIFPINGPKFFFTYTLNRARAVL